jgi:hypothetical protein
MNEKRPDDPSIVIKASRRHLHRPVLKGEKPADLPVVQPHARDEHRRHQTTSRGGPRVRNVYCCARRVTVQAAERGPRSRPELTPDSMQ